MNDLSRAPLAVEDRYPLAPRPLQPTEETATNANALVVRILRTVNRWRWLILAAIGVSLLGGVLITLLTTPQYTAFATIEIQRESYQIVNVQGVEPKTTSVDMEFYQTQYGLLRSKSLAERVARDLRLHDNASFFDMFGAKKVAAELRKGGAAVQTGAARENRIRIAGEILLKHLSISPQRASRLVDVSFTSPSAPFSAQIVNAWTKDFIQTTLDRKFDATSYARNFLEQRLGQLRQRLEESERLAVAYASNNNIINLPAAGAAEGSTTEHPLVAENLAALNRELNSATAARLAAESRLRGSGASTPEALQSQAIATMRARRAEVASDYAKMLTQFEPTYPPAQALAAQLRQLDTAIGREEGRVRSTLQENYQVATAREAALKERVAELRGDLLTTRNRSIQYNIYQREVDTNRQLYDALLQRYKEIGVAGGVGVNNVSIVDAADTPEKPSSPRLFRNLMLSLVFGTLLGGALAIILNQIDEVFSDPTDVERTLGVPLLGVIPRAEGGDARQELEDRKSPLVEAYLSAQTNLSFSTDHGFPKSILVTSSRPAEGKSTSSYALARSLARSGRRIVMIDADMRSPSLHHIFGVENDRGLSNYLTGSTGIQDILKAEDPNGVALIAAGPMPPNAADLLTGPRLGEMIQELLLRYDHVVMDIPPVMGLADAPLIAHHAEGVVFVVESHATRSTVAKVAIDRLRASRARIFGVLLTKFDAKRAHYGYGYDYGYSYGDRAERT